MKKLLILFSTVITLIPASSCYSDIDLDHYINDSGGSLLVLNSIINPDSMVKVSATRTYFFSDRHPEHNAVPDLDLGLYVNGKFCQQMKFSLTDMAYHSSFNPAPGDTVELSTSYGGKSVKATDVMPGKIKIESVEIERQGPTQYYSRNDYIFTYRITFADPPKAQNFYFIRYDGYGDGIYGFMEERNYTYEYVFQQLAKQIQVSRPGWVPYSPLGLPFSDEGIDGKTHTLILKEIVQGGVISFLHNWTCMYRNFKLYSISENYYKYLVSVLCNDTYDDSLSGGLVNIGLVEPTKIYSNITGNGVGILGAYSVADTTVNTFDTVGSFPKH